MNMRLENKSDFEILIQIMYEYIWNISKIRKMIIPAIAIISLGKLLHVQTSKIIKSFTEGITHSEYSLKPIISFSICLFLQKSITELGGIYTCSAKHIGYRIAKKRAYQYFLNLKPEDYKKISTGEMQNIIHRKAEAIKDILNVIIEQIIPLILGVIITSTNIMSVLGITPTFITLFTILIYIVATIQITIWRNEFKKKINLNQDYSQNVLNDGLSNFETIFTNGTEEYEAIRYENLLKLTQTNEIMFNKTMFILNAVQENIWGLQLVLVILYICIFNQNFNAPDLAYLLNILTIFQKSLNNLGFMYGKYKTGMINIRQIDLPVRTKHEPKNKKIVLFTNTISVYDLTYSYNNKMILECVNFTIRRGEKIAIVGQNGAGKTTLIKSLLKYNSADAQIFIDQYNIEDISEDNFRQLISYVPQSASLFNETVLYNIKYGNFHIHEDQIYKSAIYLGIHDTILKLENGYQTICGENGSKLSGGERQKIVILREYLKNTPLLLLDEPTASMDKSSEASIFATLLTKEDISILAIVHNHELLKMFDKILLIENKKIKEVTLDELVIRH
ncbi:ABC-type multidrug transport system, ATPase and permease component [Enterocytozoon bieneusi H348]|nr:ABC-type multidrug transport system, ATPase and permease component [Enterocytozoon bieneusi H348]|eukprot:XP_002649652.1 ABC-type multidrug transport system, ATPase and permease component [Enterocytozoon bieneusi H348]